MQINNSDIMEFFRSKIAEKTGSSVKEYNKAFVYLNSFVAGSDTNFVDPGERILEEWCLFLFSLGMKQTTVSHYIDIVSALYKSAVQAEIVPKTDVFKRFKSRVFKNEMIQPVRVLTEEEYARLRNFILIANKLPQEVAMYVDIFAAALISGCKSAGDIAWLKKDELSELPSQAISILERYVEPGRKYVLPLQQSKFTERQMEKHLDDKILELFKSRGIPVIGNLRETLRSYWSFAAIKCGYGPAHIRAVLGRLPLALPGMKPVGFAAEEISESDIRSITTTVGEAFLFNPVGWYAMKLRKRVTFEELQRRVGELEPSLRPLELFYPVRETVRMMGGKRVVLRQPLMPDTVFFKSRQIDILPLFVRLGDISWCYRNTRKGEYARISRDEMELFQRAVGHFTSDYEVGAVGSLQPKPGDTIKVIGGIFGGKEGELLKIIEQSESDVIYRLLITDDQGVEWRVGIDSRQTAI